MIHLKNLSLLAALLFVSLPMVAWSQNASGAGATMDNTYKLQQKVDSLASAFHELGLVAGFSAMVMKSRNTLLFKSYGKANIHLDVPASTKTKYRLIGPANTILTLLLMQQVEEGVIELDEDITHLLPYFTWQERSFTLRQLLNATSGLPDYHYLGDLFCILHRQNGR